MANISARVLRERQNMVNKVHYPSARRPRYLEYIRGANIDGVNKKNADRRGFYVGSESQEETGCNYAFEKEQMAAANCPFGASAIVGIAMRLKASIPIPPARKPQFALIARYLGDKHVMLL